MLLSLLLTTVFAVQIAYVIALALGVERAAAWRAVPHGRGENEPGAPVSVVVAARNEEDNLPALLAALAEQQHDNYEVVVVDDASTDRTADVVREWQKRVPHLRLITVEEPIHPRKKNALTIGIREARHPNLALTDADCRPAPSWLRDGSPGDQNTLVIGYSPYAPEPSLLNLFARYETLVTGQQTAAAVGLGRPFMAVGRSLFYSKHVFDRTDGFRGTLQSLSGDDDLFLQQVVKRRTARVMHLFGPRQSCVDGRTSDMARMVQAEEAPCLGRPFLSARRETTPGRVSSVVAAIMARSFFVGMDRRLAPCRSPRLPDRCGSSSGPSIER